MTRKIYAEELLKKLVSTEDMKLLDVITNDDLSTNEKIKTLVKRGK
jgi:hypothetical protein